MLRLAAGNDRAGLAAAAEQAVIGQIHQGAAYRADGNAIGLRQSHLARQHRAGLKFAQHDRLGDLPFHHFVER